MEERGGVSSDSLSFKETLKEALKRVAVNRAVFDKVKRLLFYMEEF